MAVTPGQISLELAFGMNFIPLDETMYEYWKDIDPEMCPEGQLPEDMRVFRIANSNFPSRMHILLDEDEFEWYFITT